MIPHGFKIMFYKSSTWRRFGRWTVILNFFISSSRDGDNVLIMNEIRAD